MAVAWSFPPPGDRIREDVQYVLRRGAARVTGDRSRRTSVSRLAILHERGSPPGGGAPGASVQSAGSAADPTAACSRVPVTHRPAAGLGADHPELLPEL